MAGEPRNERRGRAEAARPVRPRPRIGASMRLAARFSRPAGADRAGGIDCAAGSVGPEARIGASARGATVETSMTTSSSARGGPQHGSGSVPASGGARAAFTLLSISFSRRSSTA